MTKAEILEAYQRISSYIHKTPIATSASFNTLTGVEVFFKCENFQKVGAFKARGAINALLTLKEKHPSGVHAATHSSGNHAQALAWAAKQLGCRATIVMPSNSPKVKLDAVKGYGAEVVLCEPTLQAREETLAKVSEATGAVFVPPYNDERIITGAATCALEFLKDVPDLNAIIAPVGGGGLLAGTALSATYFSQGRTKVYAAEPTEADDAYQSFKSGKFVPSKNPNTIADGLKTSLGTINFPIIQKHVEDIFTVSESEIIESLIWVYERMKLVIEPSAAVTVAALQKNAERFKGQKVGVILSGGNVDLKHFGEWK